jgi:hypothetical protein
LCSAQVLSRSERSGPRSLPTASSALSV